MITNFKFFHGKINSSVSDFYEEFFRRFDDTTLPTFNDIRTITRNLDINRITNIINSTRTPDLIINGQRWEIRY